jgi:hypothetical protein
MEKGPFHAAKYYEYAADLREYGHDVRLNIYCQMDKVGNHKMELIDVGKMSRSEIFHEVVRIFEVDPRTLSVMRIDFAVDIPDIPLQWFRETVRVEHKRFRSAVTGDPFYSEMGNGDIQTLYFGKRPNLIRIYDKRAQYEVEFRNAIRKLDKDIEPPSFEKIMGFSKPVSKLTRVERQIGGRIPAEVQTLGHVCAERFEYRPFERLKIIDHATLPERYSSEKFETYCTGMHLRSIAENDGMQALNTFLVKYSNGNAVWARRKYAAFLPGASPMSGLNSATLQARFAHSLASQMGH